MDKPYLIVCSAPWRRPLIAKFCSRCTCKCSLYAATVSKACPHVLHRGCAPAPACAGLFLWRWRADTLLKLWKQLGKGQASAACAALRECTTKSLVFHARKLQPASAHRRRAGASCTRSCFFRAAMVASVAVHPATVQPKACGGPAAGGAFSCARACFLCADVDANAAVQPGKVQQ